MNGDDPLTHIKIWQQNTRRSLEAQLALLNSLRNNFDIVCIQEPHFDFQNLSRATRVWNSIYPTTPADNDARPRVLTLIHERISTNSWTQISVNSPDIVAFKISNGDNELTIYNIYNDCEHSLTIHALTNHFNNNQHADHILLLGDFNRHHPMWDEERNGHLFTNANLNAAEELIELIANTQLDMALPKDIPTITNSAGNTTRPDNVFISRNIKHWIVKCDTSPEDRPPKADHYPIHTVINFPIQEAEPKPMWNYRATDWTKLRETLTANLDVIPPPQVLDTTNQLEDALEALTTAITDAMEAVIPKKKPSPHSKRWWTAELSKARTDTKRLARSAYRYRFQPDHPVHNEYQTARNGYASAIKAQRMNHWKNWLEKIGEQDIWTANRFLASPPSDGGKSRIPALKTTNNDGEQIDVHNNGEKSKLLHKVFFYDPPDDHVIEPDHVYPEEKFTFDDISNEQITRAIKKLQPFKTPGMNGISNSILLHCEDLLTPFLGPIFRATFDLEHYPKQWKKYVTAAIRKPGKPDYTIPNAYRPIALLDTISKILSSCVKETLEYYTDKLQLLPVTQFGGKAGCTTTDSLHLVTNFIKDAWRRKHEVVGLFLDVKGAFPNAVIPCLVHDMREKGIPKKVTDWVSRQLDGRETVITFDDYTSEPIPIRNGLNQGDCLSTFFYRFYNAKQINKIVETMRSSRTRDKLAANFSDDAMCVASAPSLQLAAQKITQLWSQQDGLAEWSNTHFSLYEYAKFAAVGFTRKKIVDPNNPRKRIKQAPMRIRLDDQHEVTTTTSHKFLGVILDDELRFNQQADHALAKGTSWEMRTRGIAKMASGMKGKFIKRLFTGVGLTKMLYAADVWCAPIPNKRPSRGKKPKAHVQKMERIQRKIALRITGALRTTPSDLLFPHAGLPPLQLHIEKICHNSAIRIATLPKHHPLYNDARKAATRLPKRHPSSLQIILYSLPLLPHDIETVDTIKKAPSWTPPVETQISNTAEEAIELDNTNEDDIKIYTDGSGLDGNIGAAAVLTRGFHPFKIARHYLGPDTEHTVYEGECVGQLLGLHLLNQLRPHLNISTVSIAVDNQASILAHKSRKPGPGSHIVNHTHLTLTTTKRIHKNARIRVLWIPGHREIPGSERADEEAKKACEGAHRNRNNNLRFLTRGIPASKSAIKQVLRARVKKKEVKLFQASHRFPKMSRIDPSMPNTKFPREIARLDRKHSSILTQLRTAHVPLQAYLHRFKLEPSPTCPHCLIEPESVTHYLKICNAFNEPRNALQREIGLLTNIDLSILGNRKHRDALLRYIHRTGRFSESHGDLRPPEPDQ